MLDEIADTEQNGINENFNQRQRERQEGQQPNGAAAHQHLTQKQNQIPNSLRMPRISGAGKAPMPVEQKVVYAGTYPCAKGCG